MSEGIDPVRRRRAPGRGLRGMVLLLALALAGGFWVRDLHRRAEARRAFPQVEGRLAVAGVGARVEILRDARGVPHIEAQSEGDAYFALGFVHAQDRLAQMLWLVRTARGRTAEILGPEGLASDREARLLDLGGAADRRWRNLDADTRATLMAYAAGVNARIDRIRSGLSAPPLALQRTGLPLESWNPADSLAVVKLYAWGLSGTLDVSLVMSQVIARLGGFEARRFFPYGPGIPEDAGPGMTASLSGIEAPDPLRRAAGLSGRTIGSSAWVLGGALSVSGMPLLVADSHLEPTVPAYFHIDHLRGGELDVAGATLPGVPVVWTGRNRDLAWASTAARAVTTDLYVETLDPNDPHLYHDGRTWRRLEERRELIAVRGQPDEELVVRSTERGPLLEIPRHTGGEPIAVSWVGTRIPDVRSIASMLAVARAADAEALREALAEHHEPTLVIVYADATGAAGMQVAGWIPRRGLPSGLVPLPGRAPWYDWKGRVPFEELPHTALEDGAGWTIAADNPLRGTGPAEPIEWLWRTGERARRIDALLAAAVAEGPVDLRRIAALQADVEASRARALMRASLQLAGSPADLSAEAREVAGLMRSWDGRTGADSVGSAAYHVFLECLIEKLFRDALGPELMQRYLSLPQVDPSHAVFEIVSDSIAGASDTWTRRARVSEAVKASLREAWLRLSYRLGANRQKWHWGRLHPLRFQPFGPGVAAAGLDGLGPIAYGGSSATVSAAEYDSAESFRVRVASTFRFAVDTRKLDEVLVSIAPGQSEHPGHPHFDDGLDDWLEGRSRLLGTSRLFVEETSVSRLVLERRP